eukprot:365744-Chlamydomonas_euryale.AAC.20
MPPCTVPCGHEFCMACLQELKSVNEARCKPLRCPVCNDAFTANRLGEDHQDAAAEGQGKGQQETAG